MRQITALVVVSLFFFLPALRSQVRGPTAAHRLRVPENLSAAVFQASATSMKVLKAKMDLGQATALDYAVAAANLRIMFAHMDETGLTATLEQYILANPARFTEFPSEPELQESVAKVPEAERVAFIAYIQAHGLKAFHQILLSTLEGKITAMLLQQRVREGRYLATQYPTQGQRQQKMNQDPTCNASFYTGWATLYGSIVGFVVGGPVGEGIFWAGLAASYYAFVLSGC